MRISLANSPFGRTAAPPPPPPLPPLPTIELTALTADGEEFGAAIVVGAAVFGAAMLVGAANPGPRIVLVSTLNSLPKPTLLEGLGDVESLSAAVDVDAGAVGVATVVLAGVVLAGTAVVLAAAAVLEEE